MVDTTKESTNNEAGTIRNSGVSLVTVGGPKYAKSRLLKWLAEAGGAS